MKNYTTLNDKDLLEEAHRLAVSVSYYNAAEGNWSQETAEREACKAEFRACMIELKVRDIDFINKGYLL